MKEFITAPIGLIINHYSMAVTEYETGDEEPATFNRAKFIDVAFCVVDEETGDEFYTIANSYSMN